MTRSRDLCRRLSRWTFAGALCLGALAMAASAEIASGLTYPPTSDDAEPATSPRTLVTSGQTPAGQSYSLYVYDSALGLCLDVYLPDDGLTLQGCGLDTSNELFDAMVGPLPTGETVAYGPIARGAASKIQLASPSGTVLGTLDPAPVPGRTLDYFFGVLSNHPNLAINALGPNQSVVDDWSVSATEGPFQFDGTCDLKGNVQFDPGIDWETVHSTHVSLFATTPNDDCSGTLGGDENTLGQNVTLTFVGDGLVNCTAGIVTTNNVDLAFNEGTLTTSDDRVLHLSGQLRIIGSPGSQQASISLDLNGDAGGTATGTGTLDFGHVPLQLFQPCHPFNPASSADLPSLSLQATGVTG
jgi:hypothetical protein